QTAEQKVWAPRLDREVPNLRAALAWSLDASQAEGGTGLAGQAEAGTSLADQTEAGTRLAAALWRFWERHGHISEGRRWLTALLEVPGGAPSPARAQALAWAGYFAYLQSDREAAVPLARDALALGRAVDDPFAIVVALFCHALMASAAGDLDRTE